MAKAKRQHSATGTVRNAPAGSRYYKARLAPVSGQFIDSLKAEGVSRGTIEAIRDDNARRTAGAKTPADAERD